MGFSDAALATFEGCCVDSAMSFLVIEIALLPAFHKEMEILKTKQGEPLIFSVLKTEQNKSTDCVI